MELIELTRLEESPLRRLIPVSKLVLVVSIAVLAITIDNVDTLKLVCLASLLVYSLAKPSLARIKLTAFLLALTVWGTVFSQALFYSGYPRTPIVELVSPETPVIGWITGGIYVYLEGVEYGLKQSIRLIASLLAGLAVAWTTDPKDFLIYLSGVGISKSLALSTMISFRFIPIFASDASSTLAVLKLRGAGISKDKPASMLRYARKFLTPLYAALVRRARTLSVAIESRGYGQSKRRVKYELKFTKLDYAVIIAVLAVTLLIVSIKTLFYAYTVGAYYNPKLVHIYAFARKYL